MSIEIEKIRISSLPERTDLTTVTQAFAIIDTGDPTTYEKVDLKELALANSNVEIRLDKNFVTASDNVRMLQIYRNGALVTNELYELVIQPAVIGLTVTPTPINNVGYELEVISTNLELQIQTISIYVTIGSILYTRTLDYFLFQTTNPYLLDLSDYDININANETLTVKVIKGGIEQAIETDEVTIESKYFNVNKSRVGTSVVVVFTLKSGMDVNSSELINVVYQGFDTLTDTIKVSSKATQSSELKFDATLDNTGDQFVYFLSNGNNVHMVPEMLNVIISNGTVTKTASTLNGRVGYLVSFTGIERTAVIYATYTFLGTIYTTERPVAKTEITIIDLLPDRESLIVGDTDVDVNIRAYVNGDIVNIGTSYTIDPVNCSVEANVVTQPGGDTYINIKLLTATANIASFTFNFTYQGITKSKTISVLKQTIDGYRFTSRNNNYTFNNTSVITDLFIFKNDLEFDYTEGDLEVLSDLGLIWTRDDKVLANNHIKIILTNATVAGVITINYKVNGEIVCTEFITVSIKEAAKLKFGAITQNVTLLNSEPEYLHFVLASEDSIIDITNYNIDLQLAHFIVQPWTQYLPNYKTLRVSIEPGYNYGAVYSASGIATIIHNNIEYTCIVNATIKNTQIEDKLVVSNSVLNVITNTSNSITSSLKSTEVSLYVKGVKTTLNPSLLAVDTQLPSSDLIYVKSAVGDNTKIDFTTCVVPSATVLLSYNLNGVWLTEKISIISSVKSTLDTYSLIPSTNYLELPNILLSLSDDTVLSKEVTFQLFKNLIPVTNGLGLISLVYDSSKVTVALSEIGGGTYKTVISSLKENTSSLEIAVAHTTVKSRLTIKASNIDISASRYLSTSATSNTIGVGDLTFDVGEGYSYSPGLSVIAAHDDTNYITGVVKTYTAGVLVIDSEAVLGSGTFTSWFININGAPGPQGLQGLDGPAGQSLYFDVTTYPTKVGVSTNPAGPFTYTSDLKGADGTSLDFNWDGTQLGVKLAGGSTYTYVELKGATGQNVELRTDISGNLQWKLASGSTWTTLYTKAQLTGSGLEFNWSGSTLGVRVVGDTTYIYSPSLTGPAGTNGDRYSTTSASSVVVGTGAKTFTVGAGLSYTPNQVLIISSGANVMHATITSYSSTTLIVDVFATTGSGTYSSWVINLSGLEGKSGRDGTDGTDGIDGNDGLDGANGTKFMNTSNTLVACGTGMKVFTLADTSADFFVGMVVQIYDDNRLAMSGTVMSLDGTGILITVTKTYITGSYAEWVIIGSGLPGVDGEDGNDGTDGEDGDKYTTTSSSTIAIGNGLKTFTVTAGLAYVAGQYVHIITSGQLRMAGPIYSYSGTTLVVEVEYNVPSGTYSSWSIVPGGKQGIQGPQGEDGVRVADILTSPSYLPTTGLATDVKKMMYVSGVGLAICVSYNPTTNALRWVGADGSDITAGV